MEEQNKVNNKETFFARVKYLKQEVIDYANIIENLVNDLIGTTLDPLEQYMAYLKNMLSNEAIVTDEQLDRGILRLPIYLYDLNEIVHRLEVRKGISNEAAKLAECDAFLQLKEGAVVRKEKEAFGLSRHERLMALVYKTACEKIKSKIESSLEILASMKKVQSRRTQDKSLTSLAGSSVSKF